MFMSIVLWAQVAVFTHVMTYDVDWDMLGTMGELPVQGRICQIFVSRVGLSDIHEFSAG